MGNILAIDQGTTGTTAVLVDSKTFKFVDKVNHEFPQIFPRPGQVEHDLNDIWGTVRATVREVLEKSGVDASSIEAIGITNQRETTCAFNALGEPLHRAIVWQDRRTFAFCEELKSKGLGALYKKKAGLPLDPYFSGTKINWLLKQLKTTDLKVGTIDTYLLYRLTGEHKTDPSNASRTLLMDLESGDWSEELCGPLDIPMHILPKIVDSFGEFGKTAGLDFLPDGIPVMGILGDQQSALFGQACVNPGEMKCTYGTGAFMLMNTGDEIKHSENGLLTTVAYGQEGKLSYALEGSCYIAGAAVQWLRDQLNFFASSSEIESMASEIKDLDKIESIYFMPFFTGIGSPYWKSEAKACILGLSRDSGKAHIARACLEGIAFSIQDLINAMAKDAGKRPVDLRVDGGMVANDLFLSIQSSVCNLKIIRPQNIETTAFGAACAAAVGSGMMKLSDLQNHWSIGKEFRPEPDVLPYYEKKHKKWSSYIKKVF